MPSTNLNYGNDSISNPRSFDRRSKDNQRIFDKRQKVSELWRKPLL